MKKPILVLSGIILALLTLCGCELGKKNVPLATAVVEQGAWDVGARDISIEVSSHAVVISGDISSPLCIVNTDKRKILPPKADRYDSITNYKDGKVTKITIIWSTRKPDKNDVWLNRWMGITIGGGGFGLIIALISIIAFVIKIIFFRRKKVV